MPSARENYDDWAQLAGLRCVCPSGCTDRVWGDGPPHPKFAPRACDPKCEPCRRMKGRTYIPPPNTKKMNR